MNNFTKEELKYIYNSIFKGAATIRKDAHDELRDKIQSMIDDIPKCDHRSGVGYYNEQGERVHYDTDIYRCRHCDILFRFVFNNGVCVGHEDLE